ncbi:MAG TPA: hypothetical protein PKY77_16135 [Phycisphaerae bacterium]|nr:hypothetical protein [Phycisphaerae bacterium]HRY70108.1 hypothetical protein [Phycisphaerae bacterium]HSA28247.1 hypothetical protein [Phycisphaerae bacterium]
MRMTPEQRAWLVEQQRDLKRELDALVSGTSTFTYADKNERRIDLMAELDEIDRQLREEEGPTA